MTLNLVITNVTSYKEIEFLDEVASVLIIAHIYYSVHRATLKFLIKLKAI